MVTALVGLGLVLSACAAPYEFAGAELTAPQPVPDTTLESAAGPVSLTDFAGQYTYLYFGYTFCPDICPTSLATLKQVQDGLGEQSDEMAVVMVTVDPERDTPERLAEYMAHFDGSFVGLSGTDEQITEVGAPFGLYYARNAGSEATGYLVDHTSRIYLIDRAGNARVAYAHGTTAEAMQRDLEHLLESEG